MVRQLLTVDGGLVNTIINAFGGEPIYFLGSTRFYRTYYVASGVWQGIGWSSIVYLAAMGNIDTSLYEAAELDGAGIIKKMWYVTLPALLPIISITLILQVGSLLSVGHEKTLLLYSTLITKFQISSVLTYTAKVWVGMQYSYTAAVDLFTSRGQPGVGAFRNWAAKKMGQEGVW